MNDLDLCLEFVSRSRQTLRYIWRWISRKPLEIEAWFQRTTNRKWHISYRMVTWRMTSPDLESSNSWPQYAQECDISRTAGFRDSVPLSRSDVAAYTGYILWATIPLLTIRVYLHSFSCCCVRNLRNPAKLSESSNLYSSRSSNVGHRSWCQFKAHMQLLISR